MTSRCYACGMTSAHARGCPVLARKRRRTGWLVAALFVLAIAVTWRRGWSSWTELGGWIGATVGCALVWFVTNARRLVDIRRRKRLLRARAPDEPAIVWSHPNGRQRVTLLKRADGAYGRRYETWFEVEDEDGYWLPSEAGHSLYASPEIATAEIAADFPWVRDVAPVDARRADHP
jgi:hypothetical protein